MGSISFNGLSGEGHAVLSPGVLVAVKDFGVLVTTRAGKARVTGLAAPFGNWGMGLVALGYFPDDASASDPPYLVYPQFIHYSAEEFEIPTKTGGAAFLGSFFWRLAPGAVIDVYVEW